MSRELKNDSIRFKTTIDFKKAISDRAWELRLSMSEYITNLINEDLKKAGDK